MKQLKVLRVAAIAVLGLSLGTGVVSAATGTGTIGTTGPNSNNQITFNGQDTRHVRNTNNVRVENDNPQTAKTGEAEVENNTTGGSATSGDATNDSLLRANLSVSNTNSSSAALNNGGGGGSTGTVNNTGPSSNNQITFNNGSSVQVDNNNCITVKNDNRQYASTGDAEVENNTTGGNATSGNATNISTAEVTLTLSN